MKNLLEILKGTKATIAAITALVIAIVAFSGTITDLARAPARIARMEEQAARIEAKLDTVSNMAQDLRLLVCVQRAERRGESSMHCLDEWKQREDSKQ
jgi:hypothetical protein